MARVVRQGGTVAFDLVTEASLDHKTVEAWTRHGTFYNPVSRVWAVEYLQRRGLTLRGSYSRRCLKLKAIQSCSSSAETDCPPTGCTLGERAGGPTSRMRSKAARLARGRRWHRR